MQIGWNRMWRRVTRPLVRFQSVWHTVKICTRNEWNCEILRIKQTQVCAFIIFVADKRLQPSVNACDNSADNKNNVLSLATRVKPLHLLQPLYNLEDDNNADLLSAVELSHAQKSFSTFLSIKRLLSHNDQISQAEAPPVNGGVKTANLP